MATRPLFLPSLCRSRLLEVPAPSNSVLTFLVCTVLCLASQRAQAVTVYWTGTVGDWSDPAKWGGAVPTSSDDVYIFNSGTVNVTQSGETCHTLNLGDSGAGHSGTVQMTDGSLNGAMIIRVGYSGAGSFSQSGGTFHSSSDLTLGYNAGATGTYDLSGAGQLSMWGEFVGWYGSGTFTQSGGSNSVSSETGSIPLSLMLGYDTAAQGTYNLNGGQLSAESLCVGYSGAGTFTQTGGTNQITGDPIFLGYNSGSHGAYNLSGNGQLTAGEADVGYCGTGTFTQDGGTNNTNNLYLGYSSGIGTYSLNGGQLVALRETVGGGGMGTFSQTGGTNTISSTLYVNNSSASACTYNLAAGQLSAPTEIVGCSKASGTGTIAHSGGTNAIGANLYLGYNSGSSGTYNLSGTGQLSAPNEYVGYSGTGTFQQSGGTNTVATKLYVAYSTSSGCYSTYQLDGGQLSAPQESVGYVATAYFNQTGGTNTTDYLVVGDQGPGSYDLSGGQLLAGGETVCNSGYGAFSQSGGTHTVSGTLVIGYAHPTGQYSGNYNLSGTGRLSAASEILGDSGNGGISQSGGVNVTGDITLGCNPLSSGFYNLSGGQVSASSETVGSKAPGTFNQSGGANTVSGTLTVCGSFGAYTLSGAGQLSANLEDVNYNAAFTQSGGTNTAGTLSIGTSNGIGGNPGTYNLSDGQLSAATEHVGDSGTGVFTQSGGTNAANLCIAYGANSNGTYNLNGGTLAVSAFTRGVGTAIFNFGGGTLQATADLSTTMPLILTGNGGNANVDSGGHQITLAGRLSGTAGLNKLGAGTLLLTAANTYAGPTTVSAGILQAKTTTALPGYATSGRITASGGTLAVNTGGTGEWAAADIATLLANAALGPGASLGIDTTDSGVPFLYNSPITGSIGLVKLGAGTLDLGAANAYTGDTIICGGTLRLDRTDAIAQSTLDYGNYGGAVSFAAGVTSATLAGLKGNQDLALANDAGSPVTLSVGANNQSTTYGGALSGPGALVKTGIGTLTLTGASSHGEGTVISAGTLQLGDGNTLGGSVAGNIADNAALTFDNPGNQSYSGAISGSGCVEKAGPGTLLLGGANTFTGNTTISGGTLRLGAAGALQNSTLDYNSYGGALSFGALESAALGGLSGRQALALNGDDWDAVALSVGNNGASTTYSGILSGTGSLTKPGAGTLRLTGANTFTGGTTVLGGTLRLGPTAQSAVFTGGGADVQDDGTKLVFDYSNGNSPAATVLAALAASYNHGVDPFAESNGGKIFSTTAADAGRALGWMDNAGAGTVSVMQTLYGDANLDGIVDSADLTLLSQHWKVAGDWASGDFNYDGVVNSADLTLLSQNWKAGITGMSFGDALAAAGLAGTPVPEPRTLALFMSAALAAGAGVPIRRLRRQRRDCSRRRRQNSFVNVLFLHP